MDRYQKASIELDNSDSGKSKRCSLTITHDDGTVEENTCVVTSVGIKDIRQANSSRNKIDEKLKGNESATVDVHTFPDEHIKTKDKYWSREIKTDCMTNSPTLSPSPQLSLSPRVLEDNIAVGYQSQLRGWPTHNEKQRKTDSLHNNTENRKGQNTGTERQNTGTEIQNTGTKRQNTGTERKNTGTERKNTGAERRNTGTERQNSWAERKNTGTETQNTGTERQNTGTERKNTGTETENTGTERQNTGAERQNTWTERQKVRLSL